LFQVEYYSLLEELRYTQQQQQQQQQQQADGRGVLGQQAKEGSHEAAAGSGPPNRDDVSDSIRERVQQVRVSSARSMQPAYAELNLTCLFEHMIMFHGLFKSV
jgi:hypothetical protein